MMYQGRRGIRRLSRGLAVTEQLPENMPSRQLPERQHKSLMLGWLLPSWLPCRSQGCFPLNWKWLWITRAQPGASVPSCLPRDGLWTGQGCHLLP